MKAVWKNAVLAESDDTVDISGVPYFPPSSLDKTYFRESSTRTTCPFKGKASYYDAVVDGEVKRDVAWYYPEPKAGYEKIASYVAFYGPREKGVEVRK